VIVLLNYANWRFQESQAKNSATGREIGGFDRVHSYGPQDIDRQFASKHRLILRQRRGGGYWLWKPYFIHRTLAELADGDLLFYCDAGAHFVASIQPLTELCERVRQDVIPFELPFRESDWTKRDAFVLLGCDSPPFTDTPQRLASFSLWKKTTGSMLLARQWLELAQDERVLTDLANQCGLPNYPGFQGHRHDQSLFSLLTKKHGLQAFRSPARHGRESANEYLESNYGQIIEHTRAKQLSLGNKVWRTIRTTIRQVFLGTDRQPKADCRAA
jgi:hypothetical protein